MPGSPSEEAEQDGHTMGNHQRSALHQAQLPLGSADEHWGRLVEALAQHAIGVIGPWEEVLSTMGSTRAPGCTGFLATETPAEVMPAIKGRHNDTAVVCKICTVMKVSG